MDSSILPYISISAQAARKDETLKQTFSIIETEDSIYEYDLDCLACNESMYLFTVLLCVSCTLSEELLDYYLRIVSE